jgi:GDP-L-fucose synthase
LGAHFGVPEVNGKVITSSHVFWQDRKILVTGGTGMIGSRLVERLAEFGARVTVTTSSSSPKPGQARLYRDNIEYLRGDLQNAGFAKESTAGQEMVFHFASKIAGLGYNAEHPAEMMTYNTILDLQVLNAAARNGVRTFFYPSGALVYDADVAAPIREEASTAGEPVPACKGAAWAKRTCEKAIPFFTEETGMQTIIARFSNIYGPGDDFQPDSAHLIGNLIRSIAGGEPPEIWGDGSQLRSYLYVADAIEAVLLLVEQGTEHGPINIGGQVEYSVREIADTLIEISGKPLQPVYLTSPPQGLRRKILDISKFRDLTGFKESTPLREGLEKTYSWYVSDSGMAIW